MDQQIKYATTPDGVRIAYSTMGSGPPLLFLIGFPFSHLQEELKLRGNRVLFDALAEHRTLFRLNLRGTGMSQRTGVGFSPAAFLSDIIAVLDAAGVETLDVAGVAGGGDGAIELAATQPERVRSVVLINTSPYGLDDWWSTIGTCLPRPRRRRGTPGSRRRTPPRWPSSCARALTPRPSFGDSSQASIPSRKTASFRPCARCARQR
jgi:pimeloyl-ACP methyl ester carboxylesterase